MARSSYLILTCDGGGIRGLVPALLIDTFQCGQLLGNNFRRGNVQLTQTINLDDYQKVDELKKMTEAYMASAEWKEIKQWVGREFV